MSDESEGLLRCLPMAPPFLLGTISLYKVLTQTEVRDHSAGGYGANIFLTRKQCIPRRKNPVGPQPSRQILDRALAFRLDISGARDPGTRAFLDSNMPVVSTFCVWVPRPGVWKRLLIEE